MQRQVVAAVALALLVVLAGCGGDSGGYRGTGVPPTGPAGSGANDGIVKGEFATTAHSIALAITDFGAREGPDGQLDVSVTVTNNAPRTHEARLIVVAGTQNGSSQASTVMAVESNQTVTRNVTVPVAYDRWRGSLDFDWTPPNGTGN